MITKLDDIEAKNKIALKQAEMKAETTRLPSKKLKDEPVKLISNIFELEERKEKIRTSTIARREEVTTYITNQKQKLKVSQDERSIVTRQQNESRANIEKLKRKYLVVKREIVFDDGDEDEENGELNQEEKSQSYYIIKNAQKKEVLNRKMKWLDDQASKVQRETDALSATFDQINDKNTKFRDSLRKIAKDSPEMKEYEKLQKQIDELMNNYMIKKKETEKIHFEKVQNKKDITELESAIGKNVEAKMSLEESLRSILTQVADLRSKIDITSKEVELCKNANLDLWTFLQAESQKHKFESLYSTLGQLAKQLPQLKPSLQEAFATFGIQEIPFPSSAVSSFDY